MQADLIEPLLLIYRFALTEPDGTSVQLRRLLAGFSRPVVHIFQYSANPNHAHFSPHGLKKILFSEPSFRFRRGGRFVRTWWRRLVAPSLLRSKFSRVAERGWARETVAYVVVLDEESAASACRILDALRPRAYILHLMDLFCDKGLETAHHPMLVRLIRNAAHVRCISPSLGREMERIRPDRAEIAPLLSYREVETEPVSSTSKIALMGGSLYPATPRKLAFFHDCLFPAWKEFVRIHPAGELAYTGVDHAIFPEEARPMIREFGNLDDEAYCRHLREARIAILPISHQNDEAFRFSVVSRLVDYFAAGLPVIADRSHGTGTGEFLAQFEGRGAMLVQTPAEALDALRRLYGDNQFHQQQSRAALDVAANLTSPTVLRAEFERVIRSV